MRGLKYILKIINKIKKYFNKFKFFIIYFGFRYYCPFCKKIFRKLLSRGTDNEVTKNITGMGYRNCYCPVCYSTDRERLLYLYLSKKTDLFNSSKEYKLLQFAPEKNLGQILKSLPNIDYVSADLYSDNVMLKIDVTDIKFENNYFDVIICNHVLEHIENDLEAMKEIYRVLKPDGWGILQVPISYSLNKTYEDSKIVSSEDRLKYFGQKDHVRIYGFDYTGRLKNAGFFVDVFDPMVEFGSLTMKRYKLILDEKIYIVRKL